MILSEHSGGGGGAIPSHSAHVFKFALACGGTGGHIFPGLATAEVLRRQGHQVELWLAGKDIESSAVKRWPGVKHTIQAQGFQDGISFKAVTTALRLAQAVREARREMSSHPPDALLAMGSYACIPPAVAALSLRIPLLLHESNVIPGRAIGFLAVCATEVGACFEESRHYLRRARVEITGFPLRSELVAAARATSYAPRRSGRFQILVMGGSRGSTPLNDIFTQAAVHLKKVESHFHIIHLAGTQDAERIRKFYQDADIPATVHAFVQNMAEVYSLADIAICRAGAATCAELSCFGIPALLVPYPYAARDHQMENAQAMERVGAADLVREADLEPEWLAEYLEGSMNTPARLLRISRVIRQRSHMRAAEELAGRMVAVASERMSHA